MMIFLQGCEKKTTLNNSGYVATCSEGFVNWIPKFSEAVGQYCWTSRANMVNSKEPYYKNFGTSWGPRLYEPNACSTFLPNPLCVNTSLYNTRVKGAFRRHCPRPPYPRRTGTARSTKCLSLRPFWPFSRPFSAGPPCSCECWSSTWCRPSAASCSPSCLAPGSKVARWQNLIPSFPWIAPGWRAWGRNPRKGRDQIIQRSVAEP